MGWKEALWPEWKLEGDIGAGAYGRVYKIKRQDIGGTYYAALKVISVPQNEAEISILRRKNMSEQQITAYYHCFANNLSREFSVMERLKGNTNIVSYEDHKIVPHSDGIGWDVLIRMELLTPLSEYLSTHDCNEKEAVKLGIDICNALILCERENIIHRDVKPGNIFVSDFGDFKLGDFSIAQNAKLRMYGQPPQGTYNYMAPEVYRGDKYNYSIDIYSLGLILYRLLNEGRAPFLPLPPVALTASLIEDANRRRLNGACFPKPLHASMPLAGIILKACAFDPEKRYQSAGLFQKALRRCQSVQVPLSVSKQISGYMRMAADIVQETYEELAKEECTRNTDETSGIITVSGEKEVSESGSRDKKKCSMKDFFTSAGDL